MQSKFDDRNFKAIVKCTALDNKNYINCIRTFGYRNNSNGRNTFKKLIRKIQQQYNVQNIWLQKLQYLQNAQNIWLLKLQQL